MKTKTFKTDYKPRTAPAPRRTLTPGSTAANIAAFTLYAITAAVLTATIFNIQIGV